MSLTAWSRRLRSGGGGLAPELLCVPTLYHTGGGGESDGGGEFGDGEVGEVGGGGGGGALGSFTLASGSDKLATCSSGFSVAAPAPMGACERVQPRVRVRAWE